MDEAEAAYVKLATQRQTKVTETRAALCCCYGVGDTNRILLIVQSPRNLDPLLAPLLLLLVVVHAAASLRVFAFARPQPKYLQWHAEGFRRIRARLTALDILDGRLTSPPRPRPPCAGVWASVAGFLR